jgi:sigma-B regulation protein RsbU (phosphoserine phosphatase)
LLLIIINPQFVFHDKEGATQIVNLDFRLWGGLLMFVLLILEVGDRVVMKRDLQIAREIQLWLLPSNPPQVPGLEIAFATRPANTVAGDYYDVFPLPATDAQPGKFLLSVADVAGKSIPAALLMATFQASLKTLTTAPRPLLEVVDGMNRYACCNSQGGLRFTTAFLAEYDPAGHSLIYVNAGHNAPMLRRANGSMERLNAGGLPLGIHSDAVYQSGTVALAPGDWLAIFTDGVVEAINERNEEYGEERLIWVLNAGATISPPKLLSRIMVDLDTFVGTTPQHDDVTCMLIRAS